MNFIYGLHSVAAQIKNNYQVIELIYIDSSRNDSRLNELIVAAKKYNLAIEYVDKQLLDKQSGAARHQGVVAIVANLSAAVPKLEFKQFIQRYKEVSQSLVVVLDGITDSHNFGAIIRTCECFGVDAVIIPKDNSANINATVAKTSSGAVNYLPVIIVNNLVRSLEDLQQIGYWISGTTLADNSVNLFEFQPDNKIVWVMGSEDKGIRRLVAENCDYLVTIPIIGNTQSLNVSVATGVILSYTRYIQYNEATNK